MSAQPLVLNFRQIGKNDTEIVGGKSANSGEMISIGLPVPPGFATTTYAYDLFIKENKLGDFIYKTLDNINYSSQDELDSASKIIRNKINQGKLPDSLKREIISNYKKMSSGFSGNSLVAVRSSATAEDMPGTSFAGQQETFLNVKGEANVCQKIKECYASLFKARSIYYRHVNKISHPSVKLSAIVQKMIQSDVSGVMFSIDPVTNQKDRVIIEAVWGLGEMIVQGSVIPDKYVVQKDTFDILSKTISDQSVQLVKVGEITKEIPVPKKLIDKQKLSDSDIVKLAKYAVILQNHYYHPQDAEWAKEKKNLYLVQTRPVTTVGNISKNMPKTVSVDNQDNLYTALVPILTGSPASPGIGTGKVKVLKSSKELNKIQKGDVLVAVMTSPDFVPAMKKASAIVTDQGGQTSHAAIVSRELGIPCIVGTKDATSKLSSEGVVTVNGSTGEVFLGGQVKHIEVKKTDYDVSLKTATKIYVNLAEPERAREIAKYPIDGVGLLRAEFMMADIGMHPNEAIKLKVQGDYIDKLAKGLLTFAKEFYPRPVVYRASDFKTNEYRALKGGKFWEPEEPNPLLGFRGASRYVANPEVFNLELEAIKKVREKYNNLWLMIPFVRSPQELAQVRRLVSTANLFDQKTFKFWMMVELPINVILLEEFLRVGVEGVSIGSNDLTMLLLGTDRDNSEVARQFDERSKAVEWALERIIKVCNENNVSVSICGQAPSVYDDYAEKLVRMGITSISVNPDSIGRVKHLVSEAEKKI